MKYKNVQNNDNFFFNFRHSVVLGEHNTQTVTDCDKDGYCTEPVQIIPVESIISHPQYNRRQYINDIGLLRLQYEADFTPDSVRPICLPLTIEQQTKRLTSLRVTGWGKTETGSVRSPQTNVY